MPPCLFRKLGYSQVRIFAEAADDPANPARRIALGLTARSFEESLQGRAQAFFVPLPDAQLRQGSYRSTRTPPEPLRDGSTWESRRSKPGRIELDLNLLKAQRANDIAMGRPSPIENRRRTGYEPFAKFGLVAIAAHHEDRQHRPFMSVLRNAGIAAIDDPPDRGSAEAVQQLSWFSHGQEHLESVQYGTRPFGLNTIQRPFVCASRGTDDSFWKAYPRTRKWTILRREKTGGCCAPTATPPSRGP